MDAAGIICEYNPFHKGHTHHISATRAYLGDDTAVFCVMSGNFVQRGEAAVIRKHARAEAAVRCGADLVAELPLPWAIASAERFAEGGVGLLCASGLSLNLSFGSECGNIRSLERIYDALSSDAGKELTRGALSRGVSYAAARQAALDELSPEISPLLKSPNNLLGVEYIKAIKKLGAPISPVTIPREGSEHDGEPKCGIAGASYIRKLLAEKRDISPFVPDNAMPVYEAEIRAGRAVTDGNALESMMLYRLRTMSDKEYAALPDSSEGLCSRLSKYGRTEATLTDVISAVKSKRYTLSRIRRMVLAAYLGVTADMAKEPVPYIRVLAANARGQELLKKMKKTAAVPILTKPASAKKLPENARRIFELEAGASDLYALLYHDVSERRGGTEWTQSPVFI